MALQIDKSISMMDIGVLFMAASAMIASYTTQENNVSFAEKDRARIETKFDQQIHELDEETVREIQELRQDVEVIRVESAKGRQRIEDKLDRLIERELSE